LKDSFVISKHLIKSTRFLRLNGVVQALYIHLNADADDFGIVDVLATMRQTNASEQDLLTLISVGLITMLDQKDLIVYINDWNLNNNNRDVRFIKISRHLALLAEKLPNQEVMLAVINDKGKKSKKICTALEAMQNMQKLLGQ
jgi:replicative DNA helicase